MLGLPKVRVLGLIKGTSLPWTLMMNLVVRYSQLCTFGRKKVLTGFVLFLYWDPSPILLQLIPEVKSLPLNFIFK